MIIQVLKKKKRKKTKYDLNFINLTFVALLSI